MNLEQFYTRKAIGFLVLLVVAGVVAGFYSLNDYIYQQKQANGNEYESYRGTLSGEYVCLPHVDTTGPQTMECAFGLKTAVGEYYAIDFNLVPEAQQDFIVGNKISANGIITPIERLSADIWKKYSIEGIFSITDSLNNIK